MRGLSTGVSVVGMSSLFFIGADRADPMPSENERQGRSSNIFFFTTVYCMDTLFAQCSRRIPIPQRERSDAEKIVRRWQIGAYRLRVGRECEDRHECDQSDSSQFHMRWLQVTKEIIRQSAAVASVCRICWSFQIPRRLLAGSGQRLSAAH